MKFTKLDYCQYLLSTQINYTLTHLAEHSYSFSHDTINRYLRKEKLSPNLLWDNVKPVIQVSEQAYIIFDDTILDKRYSRHIELTRRQYSGNEHRVIRGIGLVNCVYVNPETDRFWVIDYRIYDPDGDGMSKLDHVEAMLESLVESKLIPFKTVLMDSWYATKNLMQLIDSLGKYYYCPLKKNRLVIESCQCRNARIQRNHIACAILVWTRLKTFAYFTGKTIYELKYGLLDNYLIQQLKRPAIAMILA